MAVIEWIMFGMTAMLLYLVVRERGRPGADRSISWLVVAMSALMVQTFVTALLIIPRGVEDIGFFWQAMAITIPTAPWAVFHYVQASVQLRRPIGIAADAAMLVFVAWTLFMPTMPGPGFAETPWYFFALQALMLAVFVLAIGATGRYTFVATNDGSRLERRRGIILTGSMVVYGTSFTVLLATSADGLVLAGNIGLMLSIGMLIAVALAPRRTTGLMSASGMDAAMRQYIDLSAADDEGATLERVLTSVAQDFGFLALAAVHTDQGLLACVGTCSLRDGAPRVLRTEEFSGGNVMLCSWAGPFSPPMRDSDGTTLGAMALMIDHALRRANEARREREVTASLHRANERLQQADDLKNRFVSLVSHEMRTPLAAIRGYAELSIEPTQNANLDDVSAHLTTIVREADHLTEIVEDLLTLSQVDQQVVELDVAVTNTSELICAALNASGWGTDGITVDVDEHSATITTDARRLQQVLINLMANAAKYGSEPLSVAASTTNGEICIAVQDDGDGVPDHLASTMFERFTRGSRNDGVPGTGLGLAIASELTEALGGTLTYAPENGSGARFVVALPRSASVDHSMTGAGAHHT